MARKYDGGSREASALDTRRRIVAAARALLLAGGYRKMTIASLATAAGVSPQTVYNSVGGKAEVVKAVYDVLLAGDDDPVPMSERPAFVAVQAAEDGVAWARAYAHWARLIWGRVGPLLGVLLEHGPGGDPVLEQFVVRIDEERRIGIQNALKGLGARGVVPRRGLVLQRLVDVVWTVNSPEVFDRLVTRCGWTLDAYEAWLARELEAAVRPTTAGG